jgi:SAM-dependent methyltransferase
VKADLVEFRSDGFDVVYCIGVLHHLKDPGKGFRSVVENTRAGGAFHCWVYGKEGNALVRLVVEPTRKIASRLPWWFTKYLIATPLVAPYYIYAKLISFLDKVAPAALKAGLRHLPLHDYSLWIAKRDFLFFRHVAFDQLVTPQTRYMSREEVSRWLKSDPRIDPSSTYVIRRNGNSWKFGGAKSSLT